MRSFYFIAFAVTITACSNIPGEKTTGTSTVSDIPFINNECIINKFINEEMAPYFYFNEYGSADDKYFEFCADKNIKNVNAHTQYLEVDGKQSYNYSDSYSRLSYNTNHMKVQELHFSDTYADTTNYIIDHNHKITIEKTGDSVKIKTVKTFDNQARLLSEIEYRYYDRRNGAFVGEHAERSREITYFPNKSVELKKNYSPTNDTSGILNAPNLTSVTDTIISELNSQGRVISKKEVTPGLYVNFYEYSYEFAGEMLASITTSHDFVFWDEKRAEKKRPIKRGVIYDNMNKIVGCYVIDLSDKDMLRNDYNVTYDSQDRVVGIQNEQQNGKVNIFTKCEYYGNTNTLRSYITYREIEKGYHPQDYGFNSVKVKFNEKGLMVEKIIEGNSNMKIDYQYTFW